MIKPWRKAKWDEGAERKAALRFRLAYKLAPVGLKSANASKPAYSGGSRASQSPRTCCPLLPLWISRGGAEGPRRAEAGGQGLRLGSCTETCACSATRDPAVSTSHDSTAALNTQFDIWVSSS